MSLGQKIKQARKKAGLTQQELAQSLSSSIRNTAISSWENDISKPDVDSLEELCPILNVHPNYFFDFDGSNAKTEWHKPLVEAYQVAEKPFQEAACAVLRIPYVEPEAEPEVEIVDMIVYSCSAAAGNPLYAEDDYERIPFPADEVPREADFGIRIRGDSMEPTIEDGSIVWVHKTNELFNRQIGIFMIDDEAACKRFFSSGKAIVLESDNDAYDPIVIHEHQAFRIVGRVLDYK